MQVGGFLNRASRGLKMTFASVVALELFAITWWFILKSSTLNSKLTREPEIVKHHTIQIQDLGTLETQGSHGRALKSVLLTVGKEQGILNFYAYKSRRILNGATILFHGCAQTGHHNEDQIELITTFIDYIRNEEYGNSVDYLLPDNNSSRDIIEARQMEIIGVLQDNLHHPSIGRIHILVCDRETADYIQSLPLENSEKLVLRVVGKDVGLKELLLYPSECLSGKIISIAHQDNKFGKGWNNKEYKDILRKHNIMYALTRHSPIKSNCTWLRHSANCDDGVKYIGSHDVFVFRANRWAEDVFNELKSITPEKSGMENLLLWFFKAKLNYRIINPCKRLFIHHHHCVPLRGKNRPRVNIGGKSLTAKFAYELF